MQERLKAVCWAWISLNVGQPLGGYGVRHLFGSSAAGVPGAANI
jgi:hypothetical protein